MFNFSHYSRINILFLASTRMPQVSKVEQLLPTAQHPHKPAFQYHSENSSRKRTFTSQISNEWSNRWNWLCTQNPSSKAAKWKGKFTMVRAHYGILCHWQKQQTRYIDSYLDYTGYLPVFFFQLLTSPYLPWLHTSPPTSLIVLQQLRLQHTVSQNPLPAGFL